MTSHSSEGRADLLDSIRRLLALASSPNRHEARFAANKAAKLMSQHRIALADVPIVYRVPERKSSRHDHQVLRNLSVKYAVPPKRK